MPHTQAPARATSHSNSRISTPVEKTKQHSPSPAQHRPFWPRPLMGYLLSVPLVGLSIIALKVESYFLPNFSFPGGPLYLAVALVAFIGGLGPAIFTICLSALTLDYFFLPPLYEFNTGWVGVEQMLRFGVVGSLIAAIIVQRGVALRRAITAEYEQHKRANQLEAVFEAMTDAVLVYDCDGQIAEANGIGRQMLHRVAHRPLREKSLPERADQIQLRDEAGHLVPEEQLPQLRILRGETLAGTHAVDIRVTIEDGQDLYASVTGSPLHDHEGKLAGAVCIYRDTTERRQLERQAQELAHEALARASELEATFEAITDSVVIYDEQGQIRRSNRAAHQLFPFTNEPTFAARSLSDRGAALAVCDEHGVPLAEEQLPAYRVLRGEVLTGIEATDILVQAAGGQRVQVSITGAPIRIADGHLIGAVVVMRDVTMRRQLEQRTHQTLSTLLTMAETLVHRNTAQTHPQSAITAAYEVISRLAELAQSALGFQHVSIIQPDAAGVLQPVVFIGFSAEQEQYVRSAALRFQASDAYTQAITRLRKDDVVFTPPPFRALYDVGVHRILYVPMVLGEQLVGILALSHGETDHDYTPDEIALAKATPRLIALVIDRERLVREQTEARANELSLLEAQRQMDEFLGITSHELRTPLTGMKGSIQIADLKLTKLLSQPARPYEEITATLDALRQLFQRADRQAELLNRLVNDLVDVSRIQANKLRLRLTMCDLAAIVRDAAHEQRQIANSRSIGLQLLPVAVLVLADADRIGQVVTNYLTNALKYSKPECAVEVRLSVEGNTARVEVCDEGPGLSPEEQERIWERFYQAQGIEVQSGSSVGLGIGLHICHTIITQHHGDIGVQSTPGQGSTFWFTLPLHEVELPLSSNGKANNSLSHQL